VLYAGLLDIFVSMLFTVFVVWVSYRVVHRLVFRRSVSDTGNLSAAILMGSILLSMGMLIQQAAEPVMNAYRLLITQEISYQVLFLRLLKVMFIYLGTALLCGILVVLTGVLLFTGLTREVNEWKAIRENNLAVALLTGIIIIVITMAVKNGLGLVFESWVPYPPTPRFY